jgi:serine/threonine-protein kinase
MRPLKPGVLIADRYRIDESIGSGGMATVYRATDVELEETIALKLFRSAGQSEDGLARFRREMKLSRRLSHPNIVHIYEFGIWHGLHFITMELLKGQDLAQLAEKRPQGRVGHAEVVGWMIQACEGLATAHAEGVVHRDVKPQNFFVQADGLLKVMDFGIAKAQSSATISVTGVRLGTPRYMSPEQIEGGRDVGHPADLYSLGVVMYELLTGLPPFRGETLVRLLLAHISETPRPPRELVPDLPLPVEKVVLRLLAKKPEHRYADCVELRDALNACL